MKASELRLGNFVYGHKTVWAIDPTDFKYYDSDKEELPYEPIPLTEEWVIKLGFVKTEDKKFSRPVCDYDYVLTRDWQEYPSYHFGIEYTDSPRKEDEGQVYHFSFEIKYVHQLQNIYFFLAHEELTIKK